VIGAASSSASSASSRSLELEDCEWTIAGFRAALGLPSLRRLAITSNGGWSDAHVEEAARLLLDVPAAHPLRHVRPPRGRLDPRCRPRSPRASPLGDRVPSVSA
jgi:hypothetical protein